MKVDVLVIGSGMAGAVAALAARRQGASVAVSRRSWGATALSTGALDLAYTPALGRAHQVERNLGEHVMDIIAHGKRHPYAVLGLERTFDGLREGCELLREVLEAAELGLPPLDLQAENVGLPSSMGAIMPAGLALGSHWGIDFSHPLGGPWGVLQLAGDPHFVVPRLIEGWSFDAQVLSGEKPDLRRVVVDLQAERTPMATAMALDRDPDALARAVEASVARLGVSLRGLIVPPVMGLDKHAQVMDRLRQAVGAPVVEALAHIPSVPGVRLQKALERAVEGAGITWLPEAVSVTERQGVVQQVQLAGGSVEPHRVVLATGRFLSGGVAWPHNGHCRESLFNLPVVSELGALEDDSPLPVVREKPTESHPLMTAGIWVSESLQPMQEGHVAYRNLHAAGMVIGGFASRYVLCSDGVAVSTATLAARAALAESKAA